MHTVLSVIWISNGEEGFMARRRETQKERSNPPTWSARPRGSRRGKVHVGRLK